MTLTYFLSSLDESHLIGSLFTLMNHAIEFQS